MSEVQVNSKPLVVGSYDEISSLIHGNAEKVVIRTKVEYETEEEKALDGQLEILPSLTVYHFDEDKGMLEALQVQVKALDEEGVETNQGGTYCSFGGVLDTSDNLPHETIVGEDGEISYELTLDDFLKVIPATAVAAAESVLGTKLDLEITAENVVVYKTGKAENNTAKLVVSALIEITKEQMDDLQDLETYDKDTINRIGGAGFSVGDIITLFDLERSIDSVCGSLITQHGVDPLSTINIRLCIQSAVNRVVGKITYQNIRDAVKLRKAADELEADLKKADEASEEKVAE